MSPEKKAENPPVGAAETVPSSGKRQSREEHIDHVNTMMTEDVEDKKVFDEDEQRDYTGVAKKTDPEEIALVRKLDWRIMVSCLPSALVAKSLC